MTLANLTEKLSQHTGILAQFNAASDQVRASILNSAEVFPDKLISVHFVYKNFGGLNAQLVGNELQVGIGAIPVMYNNQRITMEYSGLAPYAYPEMMGSPSENLYRVSTILLTAVGQEIKDNVTRYVSIIGYEEMVAIASQAALQFALSV